MKKNWLTYDLQFFADGESESEGEEESVNAEQTEVDDDDDLDDPDDEDDDEDEESEDRDSIYAAARRRAESEARNKYAREQQEIDAYYAQLCQGKVNPETNQPITTEAEYRAALDAQRRINTANELQSKGIDPNLINQMISNNPAIREAERLVAEAEQTKVQEQIEQDIKAIMALDKSFADENELMTSDEFKKAVDYVQTHNNVLLSDAYKLVNFSTLQSVGVKAAKQAAINEAKGKGHLASPKGTKGKDEVTIPDADLAKWKRFYPGKSMKELTALYAKVHQ